MEASVARRRMAEGVMCVMCDAALETVIRGVGAAFRAVIRPVSRSIFNGTSAICV